MYRLEQWSLNAYGDRETITGEVYDHPDFEDGQIIVTNTITLLDLVDLQLAVDIDDQTYYLGERYSRQDVSTVEVTITAEKEETEETDKLAEGFSGKPIC